MSDTTIRPQPDAAAREAIAALAGELQAALTDTTEDIQGRGMTYAALASDAASRVMDGTLTTGEADEVLRNCELGMRSAAINAGYDAHEKAIAAFHKGMVTAFKILAAFV